MSGVFHAGNAACAAKSVQVGSLCCLLYTVQKSCESSEVCTGTIGYLCLTPENQHFPFLGNQVSLHRGQPLDDDVYPEFPRVTQ